MSSVQPAEIPPFDSTCLGDLLPMYYEKIFPAKQMVKWLAHGSDDFFSRREFSFTLAGDVYIRYQSFSSDKDFQAELVKRKPEKIDIGAVYNQRPCSRDTLEEFIPLEKEFVLDIDLTDYDDVRTCCQGAKCCVKCWKYIAVAVEILNEALIEDFGFENLLWVYSGRRGVHCWVCDDVAVSMNGNCRQSVLEYVTMLRGGENQAKKVQIPNIDKVHSFVARALNVIDAVWMDICHDDQHLLGEGDKNFDMLPEEVKEATAKAPDRFQAVVDYMQANIDKKSIRTALAELQLQLCFPRLDYNVSKDLNHLLKSPFCIHPKTGQVCVPFNPYRVYEFVPAEVPGISQLIDELTAYDEWKDATNSRPESRDATNSRPESRDSTNSRPESRDSTNSRPESRDSTNSRPESKDSTNSWPAAMVDPNSRPRTWDSSYYRPETRDSTYYRPETRDSTYSRPETRDSTYSRPETRDSTYYRPESRDATPYVPSIAPYLNVFDFFVENLTKYTVKMKKEPSEAEPSEAEPSGAEPTKAEPTKAEPAETEPTKAEPAETDPSDDFYLI